MGGDVRFDEEERSRCQSDSARCGVLPAGRQGARRVAAADEPVQGIVVSLRIVFGSGAPSRTVWYIFHMLIIWQSGSCFN